MVTARSLNAAADKIKKATLRHAVWHALGSAETNANDTLAEGAIAADEWETCFKDSLEVFLTSREATPEVIAWFDKRGVRG